MGKTLIIYIYAFLNTFTINLRDEKHRLSLAKHMVFGIALGLVTGMVIAVLHSAFFLSMWGDKISCPILTIGENIIGCSAGFVYDMEISGGLSGAAIGFLTWGLRKIYN